MADDFKFKDVFNTRNMASKDIGAPSTERLANQLILVPWKDGGPTTWSSLNVQSTGVTISATKAQIYAIDIYNRSDPGSPAVSTERFVKLYNKAAPTVGTDTPMIRFGLMGQGGRISQAWPQGLTFSTAIGIGGVRGVADSDTTAPAANDLVVHIWYKN